MIKETNVEKMVDLVACQKGSVVSKTLIKEASGSVTLFALDQGQGLHEHSAPYDAMVYILEGTAEITLAGKPMEVKQGEMLIMPANVPHSLKAPESFKMMLAMIRS